MAENATLPLTEERKRRIIRDFSPFVRDGMPQYATFFATKGKITVTLYKDKALFQGEGALEAARKYGEPEQRKVSLKPRTCPRPKLEQIGSDETGTGNYFGPVVVCAAFLTLEDIAWAKQIGATDSKLLTDEQIAIVARKLIKRIDYSLLCLSAKRYNEVHAKGFNMNAVKAKMHNSALLRLKKKHPHATLCQDQFAEPEVYFSYLRGEKQIAKPIDFSTKGELAFPSVACASIIARHCLVRKMEELGKEYGCEFPFGAGDEVERFAKRLVKEKGEDILAKVAKVSFKNTARILSKTVQDFLEI